MSRFDTLYEKAGESGRKTFNAYLCGGDPDVHTTELLIRECERLGVDSIELGVPFSDPVADGPVIQRAAQRALGQGATLTKIISMVARLRKDCSIPIALMSYFNPIHRYSVEKFISDAADAGIDGLIIPDLPPEEADDLISQARTRDISTIFFIAPTTKPERVPAINRQSTGFIYCVSVMGITGARNTLPPELRDSLQRLRKATTLPLVVGFGISNVETVKLMCEVADGVIVGSAICREIEQHLGGKPEEVVRAVGEFIKPLVDAAHAE